MREQTYTLARAGKQVFLRLTCEILDSLRKITNHERYVKAFFTSSSLYQFSRLPCKDGTKFFPVPNIPLLYVYILICHILNL